MSCDVDFELDVLSEGDVIIIACRDFLLNGIIKRIENKQFVCKSYFSKYEIHLPHSTLRKLRKEGKIIFPALDI